MSESMDVGASQVIAPVDVQSVWGLSLQSVHCPACDWSYLVREGELALRCPHCFRANVEPLGEAWTHVPYQMPPELLLPFVVDHDVLDQRIVDFAENIPFAPHDLNPDTLCTRLQQFYFPMWLVDGDVRAMWDAEMGFDYEVVSHRERYAGGRWETEEVKETRVRWEPRVGRLDRHYDNVTAPALDAHAAFVRALGRYRLREAQPYAAQAMADALVRLPDRAQTAAWVDAALTFKKAAAEDCRQAATADHVRRFRWEPSYAHRNWTLLLLPVYGTYYLDDAGQPQPVFVNGQSGHLSGARRASMQRARRMTSIVAVVAALVFALGMVLGAAGLLMPPLLLVGVLLAVLGFFGGVMGALFPILRVSRFNRKQGGQS